MGDSGTWAAFGKQALKIKQQAQKVHSEAKSEDQAGSSKPAHQPAKMLHGEDNTDKTADQMRGEETPPQARIVAYSDSDEDDYKQHKWPTGSGSDTEEEHRASPIDHDTATVNVKQRQLIRQVPPGNKVSIGAHHAFLGFLDQHIGPPLQRFMEPPNILRMIVLASLQNTQPRAAQLLERASALVTLPSLAFRWLGKADKVQHVPASLLMAGQQLEALAAPAIAVQVIRQLLRLKIIRVPRRRRQAKSSAASQADLPLPPDSPSASSSYTSHSQQPQLEEQQHDQHQHQHQSPQQSYTTQNGHAGQPAEPYSMEVAEMRHRLRQAPAQSAARHLPDAELLRHAQACGLLKAQTAEEKAEAIEQAVDRVNCTQDWLAGQTFLTAAQLEQWSGLVRWQGRDGEGRPILVIKVAQACKEYSSSRAPLVGQAILSQVARALDGMLDEQTPQLVAVLDAQRATTVQVSRKVNYMKHLAAVLNQHYPGRLHQLYIVDLPVLLRWVVMAVKSDLQPETKPKIQICQVPSPDFPLPLSVLDFNPHSTKRSLPSSAGIDIQAGSGREGGNGYRVVRRSMSVPASTEHLGSSPSRCRDRGLEGGGPVRGLGKGIRSRSRKGLSIKEVTAPADSQLQLSSFKDTSAVAAFTLLFTLLAALYQRFVLQPLGARRAVISSPRQLA